MQTNQGLERSSILDGLLLALSSLKSHHASSSNVHTLLKQVARREVESLFAEIEPQIRGFGLFGDLVFPYSHLGSTIDSLRLFDLDELIIFSFYWINRKRYQRVLDLGANIGLHTVIMSKCGFAVQSYEPDPGHFAILRRNLVLNNGSNVQAFNAAVSDKAGEMEFVKVIGNTTSSHLAGSKANPYGELERFPVRVEAIESLITWADLIKMDVEGHEKEVLLATERNHWLSTDALVEIQNESNATAIYEHFTSMGVRLFSQKINWCAVSAMSDMPTNYREGTLFITCKSEMPWVEDCGENV